MDLAAALAQLLPISSTHYSLMFVGGAIDPERGSLVATVRLVVWDVNGEERSMGDIKEQEVEVVPAKSIDDPRLPAYFQGWAEALRVAFARLDEVIAAEGEAAAGNRVEEALPCDMFCPEVLALRRPQTAEEFAEALLSNRKRLGWLLP
ncbi:hypothetical protein [Nannocystis pusilla]|uniref:Uncharacterized protein n=1 Tax=Nannocystis pusilla TaxID=889268 RepID=A0ABS7U4N8_9BACT|nr:hypothetical protein [Nannocystis pusilla]MBZ5715386.1 hypothetical protein [Nannocystis pusilla]